MPILLLLLKDFTITWMLTEVTISGGINTELRMDKNNNNIPNEKQRKEEKKLCKNCITYENISRNFNVFRRCIFVARFFFFLSSL